MADCTEHNKQYQTQTGGQPLTNDTITAPATRRNVKTLNDHNLNTLYLKLNDNFHSDTHTSHQLLFLLLIYCYPYSYFIL